jgi:hypothetical protein
MSPPLGCGGDKWQRSMHSRSAAMMSPGVLADQVLVQFLDAARSRLLVIVLAHFAQRAWRSNDDEAGDFVRSTCLLSQLQRRLAWASSSILPAWLAGAGMVARRRMVVPVQLGNCEGAQFRRGLVAGVAVQFEILAIDQGKTVPWGSSIQRFSLVFN